MSGVFDTGQALSSLLGSTSPRLTKHIMGAAVIALRLGGGRSIGSGAY